MAANISSTITDWSTVAGSNQPDGTDPASSLVDDLRAIQSACRKESMKTRLQIEVQTAWVTATATDSILDLTAVFRNANVTGKTDLCTVGSMVMNSGSTYNLHFGGDNAIVFKTGSPLTLPYGKSTMTCVSGMNWEFSFDGSNQITTKLENYPRGRHHEELFGGVITITGSEQTLDLTNRHRYMIANTNATGATAMTIASAIVNPGQVCTLRFNGGATVVRRSADFLNELAAALTTCLGGDFLTIGRSSDTAGYSDIKWCLHTNKAVS